MKTTFSQANHAIRYIVAGVVVITAILFHVRKWDVPSPVVSQSDINQVCRSVAGCKALEIGHTFSAERAKWVAKVIVTADRKVKNPALQQQITANLEHLWDGKAGWMVAGLEGQTTEVRYE